MGRRIQASDAKIKFAGPISIGRPNQSNRYDDRVRALSPFSSYTSWDRDLDVPVSFLAPPTTIRCSTLKSVVCQWAGVTWSGARMVMA